MATDFVGQKQKHRQRTSSRRATAGRVGLAPDSDLRQWFVELVCKAQREMDNLSRMEVAGFEARRPGGPGQDEREELHEESF